MAQKTTTDMYSILANEIVEAGKLLVESHASDLSIRLYTRMIFSILDGLAFYLKQEALWVGQTENVVFSSDELDLIHERRLRTVGTMTVARPKTIDTETNVRLAIGLWARVTKITPSPGVLQIPQDFAIARRVRNRFTHPKKPSDFHATDDEIGSVTNVMQWLLRVMQWTIEAKREHHDSKMKLLFDEFERVVRAAEELNRKAEALRESPEFPRS